MADVAKAAGVAVQTVYFTFHTKRFGAALTGGFNLLAPWLLFAYGLFGALIVYGGSVSAPYVVRLSDAVLQDRPDRDALLGRRLTVILAIDALIYVLIIADMVLKPLRY